MGLRGSKPKRGEVIWSERIAYAVGLMATDGCLSNDGRHLELSSKDREQLSNFLICIDREVTISKKKSGFTDKEFYRIQFSDVTLYRFLESIGLTPRKTLTMGALSVPDEFFFDFLRGHHDGDGSFYSYFDPRWKSSFMFYLSFVSASEAHVVWLRKRIHHLSGVKGHVTTDRNRGIYQLKFGKAESMVILARMYARGSSVHLRRKRLKIQSALRIVGQSLPSS